MVNELSSYSLGIYSPGRETNKCAKTAVRKVKKGSTKEGPLNQTYFFITSLKECCFSKMHL